MGVQAFFENYSPVGDLITVAMCIVIFWLVFTSYVKKSKAFWLFINIVSYLLVASVSNLICHALFARITDGHYASVQGFRVLFHAMLFSILLLFVVYIVVYQRLEARKRIPIMVISSVLYAVVVGTDIVTTLRGTDFEVSAGHAVSTNTLFLFGYLGFILIILFLIIAYRKRLFKRVMYGFYGAIFVSLLVLFLQGQFEQSSYTTASFLFPTLAMLYILHSTPYDAEIGSIDAKALEDLVEYSYKHKQDLIYFSLYLPDFDKEGTTFPPELQRTIRNYWGKYYKNAVLFQVNNGHVILVEKARHNPKIKERIGDILKDFATEYGNFGLDYKIVMGNSVDEISENNEYLRFIGFIHRNMAMNEVHFVSDEDVHRFRETEYILSELADINRKRDPKDPRVLVYCQPIYDIRSGRYDTAEALMRLNLPGLGMVFPDQFISLAEESGYIHVLTGIILRKTCEEIRRLVEQGYYVRRISVNVSAVDLHQKDFTKGIVQTIRSAGIPENKLAIELTESRIERDFPLAKKKIEELKDRGIMFYLDDFGTGYSNMERILELPFDIIKFDRSLILASHTDRRSEKMVTSLANMFRELDYSILYEGVETENDEEQCIQMSASYLQGYRYSRPMPIEELDRFFSKESTGAMENEC